MCVLHLSMYIVVAYFLSFKLVQAFTSAIIFMINMIENI